MERIGFCLKVLLLQVIHENAFPGWVHNPIFPHPGICVKIQLHHVVMAGITWGNDFNNPVRGSGTAPVRELAPVTYHTYIRFNYGIPVLSQLHSEGGWKNPAGTAFRSEIIPYRSG